MKEVRKTFSANRIKKNPLLLCIVILPFIILGALIALGSAAEEFEAGPFAIGMGIFGFGMLIFILAKYFTAPRKVSYEIGADRIFLKSSRGEERLFSYPVIDTVAALKEKQAEEMLYKLRLKLEEKNAAIMRSEGTSRGVFANLKEAVEEQKNHLPHIIF